MGQKDLAQNDYFNDKLSVMNDNGTKEKENSAEKALLVKRHAYVGVVKTRSLFRLFP